MFRICIGEDDRSLCQFFPRNAFQRGSFVLALLKCQQQCGDLKYCFPVPGNSILATDRLKDSIHDGEIDTVH